MRAMPPSVYWSIRSWNTRSALEATIKVQDPALFDRRSRELSDLLQPFVTAQSDVLDIGCGIGRPERDLAPHVRHIYGADISRRMLDIAAKRHAGVAGVSWHRISGADLAFLPEASIDFAFSELVFQHVVKDKVVRLWTDLLRVLRPGGLAYFQLLNAEAPYNVRRFIARALEADRTPGDVWLWSVPEARAVVTALGYSVERIDVVSDFRGPDGSVLDDEAHRDYSIWVSARKPGHGAVLADPKTD